MGNDGFMNSKEKKTTNTFSPPAHESTPLIIIGSDASSCTMRMQNRNKKKE